MVRRNGRSYARKSISSKTIWSISALVSLWFVIFSLSVDCISKTEDDFRKLHGLVESRLRFMIKTLDNTEGIEYVHPKMGAVNFKPEEEGSQACAFFIGLSYKQGVTAV